MWGASCEHSCDSVDCHRPLIPLPCARLCLGPRTGLRHDSSQSSQDSGKLLHSWSPRLKLAEGKGARGQVQERPAQASRHLSWQSHRGGMMWAAEALTSRLLGRPGAWAALRNQRPGAGEGRGPYDNSAELPSRNMSRRGCNRPTPAAESRQPCPGQAAAELEGRGGGRWAWSGLLTAQTGPTTLRGVQPLPRPHFPSD